MTVGTIKLVEAAKYYKAEPHQIAAWNWLEAKCRDQLAEFAELYRAAPPPKAMLPPPWLELALKTIKAFEGCRLEAYKDAAGVPTIGYGTTRYMDAPVRMSDKISQAMAEELLANDVEHLSGPGVLSLLPMATKWRPNQVAALTSFAYNLGLGALENSTLRARLLAGQDACTVVREELPKWIHAGEAVLPGLEKRRQAEVELFCSGTQLQQAPFTNPLKVPYYSQRDSEMPGQGNRMCFSSSCAMLVATLRPEALSGANADDAYLKRVLQYGDTTDANAQLKALQSYGIKAAAKSYFGITDLAKLTIAQSAVLAAIPQSPSVYDLVANATEVVGPDGKTYLEVSAGTAMRSLWAATKAPPSQPTRFENTTRQGTAMLMAMTP